MAHAGLTAKRQSDERCFLPEHETATDTMKPCSKPIAKSMAGREALQWACCRSATSVRSRRP